MVDLCDWGSVVMVEGSDADSRKSGGFDAGEALIADERAAYGVAHARQGKGWQLAGAPNDDHHRKRELSPTHLASCSPISLGCEQLRLSLGVSFNIREVHPRACECRSGESHLSGAGGASLVDVGLESSEEDTCDEVYLRRHLPFEISERDHSTLAYANESGAGERSKGRPVQKQGASSLNDAQQSLLGRHSRLWKTCPDSAQTAPWRPALRKKKRRFTVVLIEATFHRRTSFHLHQERHVVRICADVHRARCVVSQKHVHRMSSIWTGVVSWNEGYALYH